MSIREYASGDTRWLWRENLEQSIEMNARWYVQKLIGHSTFVQTSFRL
jgi:hypothetical protein